MHQVRTEGIEGLHACAQHLKQSGDAAAGPFECRNLIVMDRAEIATMIRGHDIVHIVGAEARLLLWMQLIQVTGDSAADRLGDVQHFHRLPRIGARRRAGHRVSPLCAR